MLLIKRNRLTLFSPFLLLQWYFTSLTRSRNEKIRDQCRLTFLASLHQTISCQITLLFTAWPRARNSHSHTRKMRVILISCECEKYPLANNCEFESSMSSKHLERICLWSHQFASGKNLTGQTLPVD